MSAPSIRRAYSFVCRECAHAWDGVFEFRQTADGHGVKLAVCYQDGVRVPSPLTESSCPRCVSRNVRVLTPGQVMRPGKVLE